MTERGREGAREYEKVGEEEAIKGRIECEGKNECDRGRARGAGDR